MSQPTNLSGRRPSAEQEALLAAAAEHWRKTGNEAPVQAIARVEEAAKQLVALNGTLEGIYFAVFAFSDLRVQVNGWLGLLVLLPVLLWLLSLLFATLVFVPRVRDIDLDDMRPGAWIELRDAYTELGLRKLRWLHWSHGWLLVSFVAVLLLLGTLVFVAVPAPSGPTEIMLVTATPMVTPTP